MAIISEGISGGFRGRVGAVVGYYRLGKWVMRGLPKKSAKNKIGTAAQKESRSLFTKMQHFLAPILDYIRIGFNMEARSRQMTAHNAAKSYNMRHAFTTNGEIDYSKVMISYGLLPGVLGARVEKDDAGFHVSWADNTEEKAAKYDDQLIFLAYDVVNGKAFGTKTGAKRMLQKDSILIPEEGRGQAYHIWLAFIADNREKISKSSYMGSFEF